MRMILKKVTVDDINKMKNKKKEVHKNIYSHKNLSFEKDLAAELEAYAKTYSGNNFSGYVVFLHNQFREWFETDRLEKMKNFYDKFFNNPHIKALADKHFYGEIDLFIFNCIKKWEEMNKD